MSHTYELGSLGPPFSFLKNSHFRHSEKLKKSKTQNLEKINFDKLKNNKVLKNINK